MRIFFKQLKMSGWKNLGLFAYYVPVQLSSLYWHLIFFGLNKLENMVLYRVSLYPEICDFLKIVRKFVIIMGD